MITVAIIEDEQVEADALLRVLRDYEKDVNEKINVYIFSDPAKFLQSYKALYDVIFFDIELPAMSGIEAAQELRKTDKNVNIIFVTNMPNYALHGYKVNALDYFLKPVTYFDLKLRMEQVRIDKEDRVPVVSISMPGSKKNIISSNIYFIEVMDHALIYHTKEGDFSITRGESLKNLEKQLQPAGFAKCSSSYLVNLKWCREIVGDQVDVAGSKLRISRGMKAEFVKRLSETIMKKLQEVG